MKLLLGFIALAAAVLLVAGQENKPSPVPAPIAASDAAPAAVEAVPKESLKGSESAYYPFYPLYSYPYAAYPYYRPYYYSYPHYSYYG